MSKASTIVRKLLESGDDFDPEDIMLATPKLPFPRMAVRKLWSKWNVPATNYNGYWMPDLMLSKDLLWRKDKWIEEYGKPPEKTPRQKNVDIPIVELTWRFLNRRRGAPVGDSETIFQTPNFEARLNPRDIEPYQDNPAEAQVKLTVSTYYFYLIDFSPEQLAEVHNHLWDWKQAVHTWPHHWDPTINPLPK